MKKNWENQLQSRLTMKQDRSFNDIIPISIKVLPREQKQFATPNNLNYDYTPPIVQVKLFSEWPGNEEANNFDFGLNSDILFEDPDYALIKLPISISSDTLAEIKWLRPDEYIKENNLQKKLEEKLPNRNHIKLRRYIKENLHYSKTTNKENNKDSNEITNNEKVHKNLLKASSSSDLFAYLDENYETYKLKLINKEFAKFYKLNLDINVVNVSERDETEEEISKRKEDFELNSKIITSKTDKKLKNNNEILTEFVSTPLKIKAINPSNIDMSDKYPTFSKWVASIFQIIKDLHITDVNDPKETIINKIYPQKDRMPLYNPSGRYWVKLFHLGKYRKIEIDHSMPCGKYEEFLLPKCEKLEELWPAILTKALIKLFSYKFNNVNYSSEEVGDSSVMYALTGYIGEKITLESLLNNNLEISQEISKSNNLRLKKMMYNLTSDERYSTGQKILIAYKSTQEIQTESYSIEDRSEKPRSFIHKKEDDFPVLGSPDVSRKSIRKFTSSRKEFGNDKKIISVDVFKDVEYDKHPQKEETYKNLPEKTEDLNEIKRRFSQYYTKINSTLELMQFPEEDKIKQAISSVTSFKNIMFNEKLNHIFVDYAYSIIEVFRNATFNMKRLKPLDYTDLLKKIEDAKISFKKHTNKDEKTSHINNLNDLKIKLKDEKINRLHDIKKPGKNTCLVKIKSECADRNDVPYSYLIPYKLEQIEMAKICILNNWDFPPPDFFESSFVISSDPNFISHYKNEDEEAYNIRVKNKLAKSTEWTKEFYLNLINNDLEKYSNVKETLKRLCGEWIEEAKFYDLFSNLIILHNPTFYKSSITIDNSWCNYLNDLNQPTNSYSVLHFIPDSKLGNTNANFLSGMDHPSNNKIHQNNSTILFLFEPIANNTSIRQSNLDYYINADLHEVDNSNTINESYKRISLKQFYSAFQCDFIEFSKEYIMIIRGGVVPQGYHLRILSDHNIDHMSFSTFLQKFRKYKSIIFNLAHPNLASNNYYTIGRIKFTMTVKSENSDPNLIISLNKYNDNYLKKNFEFYLVKSTNDTTNNSKQRIFLDKIFSLGSYENNEKFYLVVSINPLVNILEKTFELEILTDSKNINFELIENMSPFEIQDKFLPNKHGIVLNELIFIPINAVVCSDLNLTISTANENPANFQKIRMNIEISRDEILLYNHDFYNHTTLINLVLNNKKDSLSNSNNNENTPFFIKCFLDMSECPSFLESAQEYSSKYTWSIRVFSTDTIVFVKNTLKEDNERLMKDRWEIDEPGRLDRARKARFKYLIFQKKELGDNITEEEKNILEDERIRRKKEITLITNLNMANISSATYSIKINDKSKASLTNNKIQLPVILCTQPEEEKLNLNKELRSIDSYRSNFTKNFIKYSNGERVMKKYKTNRNSESTGNLNFCRTENNIEDMKKSVGNAVENFHNNWRREVEDYMNINREAKEKYRKLFHSGQRYKNSIVKSLESLQKDREELREKLEDLNQNDSMLKNILNDFPTCNLQYAIASFLDIKNNPLPKTQMLLDKVFKIISQKKEEIILADIKKYSPKDKIILIKHLEDLKFNEWEISGSVFKKLNEFCY